MTTASSGIPNHLHTRPTLRTLQHGPPTYFRVITDRGGRYYYAPEMHTTSLANRSCTHTRFIFTGLTGLPDITLLLVEPKLTEPSSPVPLRLRLHIHEHKMTPEEITALFATAATTFQPIIAQPTDDNLTALREVICPWLLDIPYDELGTHNLIGLVKPMITYVNMWHAPFSIPPRPPAYSVVADDATSVVQAHCKAEHDILVKDYATYKTAERTMAKFIHKAIDEIWYRDLRHVRSFYTNVTAKELIEHLDANCRGLHPSEPVNLPTKMLGYYIQADGIPEYINMLEEASKNSLEPTSQCPMTNTSQSPPLPYWPPNTSQALQTNGKPNHMRPRHGLHGKPTTKQPTSCASVNYLQQEPNLMRPAKPMQSPPWTTQLYQRTPSRASTGTLIILLLQPPRSAPRSSNSSRIMQRSQPMSLCSRQASPPLHQRTRSLPTES
jgi:hypothetical protein